MPLSDLLADSPDLDSLEIVEPIMELESLRADDGSGLDDLPAALVRQPGPRGPLGKLGASVHPPEVDTPEDDPCA